MNENERLALLRKKLNLTLEKFGERIGVTGSAIGNIEKGRRALTDQVIKSVSREFNVNENWLRYGEDKMFDKSKNSHLSELAKQYALDDMGIKVVEAFLELSPEKREAIIEYVRSIAENFKNRSEEDIIRERIDREVEAYRRELELEIKSGRKLSRLDDLSEVTKNKKNMLDR
ncbi:helix-turn-helix domain-containing protein [Peptoniphilus sp. GNH]|nr:helix-turn-helix domain-containing protein [Peptoniphilus sp. GNH]